MAEPLGCAVNTDAWVIVPAYNEGLVVREVVTKLLGLFANVVVVDDGSSDDTAAQVRAAGAKLIRHRENLGVGAAIQTGLEFALLDPRAKFFVTFDADGQHRAEDAEAMVARLREGGVEILFGSRFLGQVHGIRPGRRLLLQAARVFERTTSGIWLSDAHNGLRAFSRAFAARLHFAHADMAHASELLAAAAASGLSYAEHPVTVEYTDYSRGKGQSNLNSVNIAVDVLLRQLFDGHAGSRAS